MTDELTEKYTQAIESLTLIPSGGGAYEVMVDGKLIYSKKATGRHAEEGEVAGLFEQETGVQVMVRE